MRNKCVEDGSPADCGPRADWSKMPAFAVGATERGREARDPGVRRGTGLKPGLY